MNRYSALGLVQAATHGVDVLVLTDHLRAVRPALDEVMRVIAGLAGVRTHRASGREALEFPGGGSLRFQSVRGDLRGQSASAVYLDDGAALTLDAPTRRDLHLVCPSGNIVNA